MFSIIKVKDGKVIYWVLKSDMMKKLFWIFNVGNVSEGLLMGEWEDMCFDLKNFDEYWLIEVFRDGKGGFGGEGVEVKF